MASRLGASCCHGHLSVGSAAAGKRSETSFVGSAGAASRATSSSTRLLGFCCCVPWVADWSSECCSGFAADCYQMSVPCSGSPCWPVAIATPAIAQQKRQVWVRSHTKCLSMVGSTIEKCWIEERSGVLTANYFTLTWTPWLLLLVARRLSSFLFILLLFLVFFQNWVEVIYLSFMFQGKSSLLRLCVKRLFLRRSNLKSVKM